MSDIENRPPTAVLSSKSGLKDGITKPKDKIIKPKVRNWQAGQYVLLLSECHDHVPESACYIQWIVTGKVCAGEVEWFWEEEAANPAAFEQKPGFAGESHFDFMTWQYTWW